MESELDEAAPAEAASRMRANVARLLERVGADFAHFVSARSYPCIGARSALRRGGCEVYIYGAMDDDATSRTLAADLRSFTRNVDRQRAALVAFVAVFLEPAPETEADFEARLWHQLSALTAVDDSRMQDHACDYDTADPHYAFTLHRTRYFVIGLHPESSRLARRLPWPALVFNPHSQFERLRAEGRFESMRRTTRARDIALQGSINPNLADVGERSEARQYSGRDVEDDWRCPFHR